VCQFSQLIFTRALKYLKNQRLFRFFKNLPQFPPDCANIISKKRLENCSSPALRINITRLISCYFFFAGAFFAGAFFAGAFFAGAFFAAGFFAAGFLAAGFLAAGFLAAAAFFTAMFFTTFPSPQ
jgi:hypothetical protein